MSPPRPPCAPHMPAPARSLGNARPRGHASSRLRRPPPRRGGPSRRVSGGRTHNPPLFTPAAMDAYFKGLIIGSSCGKEGLIRARGPEKRAPMRENRKDKRIAEENRVAIELRPPPVRRSPHRQRPDKGHLPRRGAPRDRPPLRGRVLAPHDALPLQIETDHQGPGRRPLEPHGRRRPLRDGGRVRARHPTGVLVLINHLYGKGQTAPAAVQA